MDEDPVLLSAIERLQRVGWFDRVMRTPEHVIPQKTDLGRIRFEQLGRIFDELDHDKAGISAEEIQVILRFVNAS